MTKVELQEELATTRAALTMSRKRTQHETAVSEHRRDALRQVKHSVAAFNATKVLAECVLEDDRVGPPSDPCLAGDTHRFLTHLFSILSSVPLE